MIRCDSSLILGRVTGVVIGLSLSSCGSGSADGDASEASSSAPATNASAATDPAASEIPGGDPAAGAGEGGADDIQASNQSCPTLSPEHGAACDQLVLCEYELSSCYCNLDGTWDCDLRGAKDNPSDCPAERPGRRTSCDSTGTVCQFGSDDFCQCADDGVWDCDRADDIDPATDEGASGCPDDVPSGDCDQGLATCQYDAVSCFCFGQWHCQE